MDDIKEIEKTIQEIVDTYQADEILKTNRLIEYVKLVSQQGYFRGKIDAIKEVSDILNASKEICLSVYEKKYEHIVANTPVTPTTLLITTAESERLKEQVGSADTLNFINFSKGPVRVVIDDTIDGDYKFK